MSIFAKIVTFGVLSSRHEGTLQGQGTTGKKIVVYLTNKLAKAQLFVLQSPLVVHPNIESHLNYLRSRKVKWMIKHNMNFLNWFDKKVLDEMKNLNNTEENMIHWLASGSRTIMNSFDGYDINHYTFYIINPDWRLLYGIVV